MVAIPVAIFEAGYSKDQELEADREGTHLAVWAGYSPLGAVRMFETFDRLYQEYVRRAQSPQEELSHVAIETLEGYFRSHPLPSERIEQIRKLIADEHWGDLNHERDLEVAYIFWTERARAGLRSRALQGGGGLGTTVAGGESGPADSPSWRLATRNLRRRIFPRRHRPSARRWKRRRMTTNWWPLTATRWPHDTRPPSRFRNSKPCWPSTLS